MGKDVFGNEAAIGGVFSLDTAAVTIGNKGSALLATNIQMNYQRGFAQVQPLTTPNRYLYVGKGQGTMNIGAMVGGATELKEFLDYFADACNVSDASNYITVTPQAKVCGTDAEKVKPGAVFVCGALLLTTVGVQIVQMEQYNVGRFDSTLQLTMFNFSLK